MRSAICSRGDRVNIPPGPRSRWARISTPSRPAANSTARSASAPHSLVNWTNEEGARFAPAMLASGVFAGVFTPDYAYSRTDREGKTFGEELKRIGYKGGEKAGAHKFSA